MRLLNTTSLGLFEFFGDQVPPYAILSHTWEDEEVSFQYIQEPACKELRGFAKNGRMLSASEGGRARLGLDRHMLYR
jgi:hypothetical protein